MESLLVVDVAKYNQVPCKLDVTLIQPRLIFNFLFLLVPEDKGN